MFEIAAYGLLAICGVLALTGGFLAVWRLVPRHHANIAPSELLALIKGLRLEHDELYEKFESFLQRDRGRKRKKDREEEEQLPVAAAPAEVTPIDFKRALRDRAKELGLRA